MGKGDLLITKLYQALNVMNCESKIARSYGTSHELTYSDIGLLRCVQHNEDAKASELSQCLGITNGAVAQLAKKLEMKGYIEPYRIASNKKEVYYRLTAKGEAACRGCEEHYEEIKENIRSYLETLDEETLDRISELFDVFVHSVEVYDHCSIKPCSSDAAGTEGTRVRRCEKCQRIIS